MFSISWNFFFLFSSLVLSAFFSAAFYNSRLYFWYNSMQLLRKSLETINSWDLVLLLYSVSYTNLCEIREVSWRLPCKTSLLTENPCSTLLWPWDCINMILEICHRPLNWLSFAKYIPRNVSRDYPVKLNFKNNFSCSKLAVWINLSNWLFTFPATWVVILSNEYSLSANAVNLRQDC